MRSLALALATIVATTTIAHAQPAADPVAQAKQLYIEGKAHYDLGEYADAIVSWKAAYQLSKAPMLLFNIAQAARLAGDCASALRTYATYEREAKKPISNAEELELARGRCNPAPTNAKPPDDGRATPHPPSNTSSPPPPSLDRDPERDRGAVAVGVDAINEPPAPPPPHESTAGLTNEHLGIGVAIAGAALLGTSYYFANAASSHASEVSSYIGEWTQTQADLASAGQRDATIGTTLAIAGSVAVLGGAALFVLGYRAHAHAQVTVAITPTTSEVAWRVRF